MCRPEIASCHGLKIKGAPWKCWINRQGLHCVSLSYNRRGEWISPPQKYYKTYTVYIDVYKLVVFFFVHVCMCVQVGQGPIKMHSTEWYQNGARLFVGMQSVLHV